MWNKALSKEGAAFIEGWHLREQMRQTETMAIRKIIKMHMRVNITKKNFSYHILM